MIFVNRGGQQQFSSFLVFLFFIGFYNLILISFSRYSFNLDDIWMWLDIYDKKAIWNGYTPSSGRFFPLASFDLNILMQFSSSPYLFFTYNAIIATAFAFIYLKILDNTSPSKINLLIIALFMLSMGFVVIFFGICYPEKNMILFLSIFMLCTFYIIKNNDSRYIPCGILFLNLSIYLKEPTFIATFCIGFLLFISSFKNNKNITIYSILIMLSSTIYCILYFILIFNNIESSYDRYTQNTDVITITIQGIINYILNDGIIIFLLPTLFIYRIFRVCIKKDKFEIFFDSFLSAGFVYLCIYLFLGIFETYYLLPCYIFSGASILYFLINQQYIKFIVIKIALILGLLGFFSSSLLFGIYSMINLKAQGVQFNEILDFSAKYLKHNPNTDIYFDGTGRGREIYAEYYVGYYAEYLNKIYNIKEFDIKTSMPNLKDIKIDSKKAYTYFNSLDLHTPKSGDLIILNNTTTNKIDEKYMQDLNNKYTLIYKTNFPTIPYVNIKSIIKFANLNLTKSNHSLFGHQNIFRLPLNTYIFKAK